MGWLAAQVLFQLSLLQFPAGVQGCRPLCQGAYTPAWPSKGPSPKTRALGLIYFRNVTGHAIPLLVCDKNKTK